MKPVSTSQTILSWPSFHGPLPKKLRSPFPNHMGTAVGGFGFSTLGGVSVTALLVQPARKPAPHTKNRMPLERDNRRGGKLNTGEAFQNLKLISGILIHKPFTAVNHLGRSGQHHLAIFAPLDGQDASGRVHIDPAVCSVIDS